MNLVNFFSFGTETCRTLLAAVFLILFIFPNELFAQSKFLHTWEIQVTNDYDESIEITITDVVPDTVAYTSVISSSDSERYSFGTVGSGYDFNYGLANNLYKIKIEVDETKTTTFQYVLCQSAPASMDFYCPNSSADNADFDFVITDTGHIEVIPGSVSPTSGSTDLTTHFLDSYWIEPPRICWRL